MNPNDPTTQRFIGIINRLGQANTGLTVQLAEMQTIIAEKDAEIAEVRRRLADLEKDMAGRP